MNNKGNKNVNQRLREWYTEEDKVKNIKTSKYFADACDISRNQKLTKKSFASTSKNNTKKSNGLLPLSGSEPHYDPKKWNENYLDRLNHNCYAYFLDDLVKGRPKRPQPGHVDPNLEVFRKQDYTREELSRRAIYDNPSIYCTDPDGRCEKGYYKGVLVIDRYNNYHWLIQNSNGYWSHKPGQLEVTNVDADGKLIKDPRTANLLYDRESRDYKLLYSDIGPFFCVPSKKETKIDIRSKTCDQCGGGINKNNRSRICSKCNLRH